MLIWHSSIAIFFIKKFSVNTFLNHFLSSNFQRFSKHTMSNERFEYYHKKENETFERMIFQFENSNVNLNFLWREKFITYYYTKKVHVVSLTFHACNGDILKYEG